MSEEKSECTCVCHVSSNVCCELCFIGEEKIILHIKKLEKELNDFIIRVNEVGEVYHKDFNGRIRKIEEEIKRKPELSYSPEGVKVYFDSRFAEMEDQIKELLGKQDFHQALTNASISANKKPHKCPVCDGDGKCLSKLASFVNSKQVLIDCHTCEGKGIVWG